MMMARARTTVAAALGVALAGACAAAAPRAEADEALHLLSDALPHANCSAHLRGRLPAVAHVIDSAAVAAATTRLDSPPRSYSVLSLSFDSAGALRALHGIASTQAPDAERRLHEAVHASIRPHRSEPNLLRLRVDVGPPIAIRTGRSVTCAPQLNNRDVIARELQNVMRRSDLAHYFTRPHQATVWVRVLEDGSIGETRVVRSTGLPVIDTEAMAIACFARFEPASIDGRSVAVWASIPLHFRPGQPTRRSHDQH